MGRSRRVVIAAVYFLESQPKKREVKAKGPGENGKIIPPVSEASRKI